MSCLKAIPFILILSACCQAPIKPEVTMPEKKEKIIIDGRLMLPCKEELSILKKGAEPIDVLKAHGEDAVTYKECADRNAGLRDVVRKALE